MKFRYIAEKENMSVFGYDFSNGATPDVIEEIYIRKLSGNNHFEAAKESNKKPVKPVTAEPVIDVPNVDLDSQTEWPV